MNNRSLFSASILLISLVSATSLQAKDDSKFALLTATEAGDAKAVARLLEEEGADANLKYQSGTVALHIAANLGHREIIELLLAKGANVNARDKNDGDPPPCRRLRGAGSKTAESPARPGGRAGSRRCSACSPRVLVRNRATMEGNLATASPIGDSAPLLLTLDASIVIASAHGERTVEVSEFFLGYRKTALRPGEIILAIHVPRLETKKGETRMVDFLKVSKRRELDISIVA